MAVRPPQPLTQRDTRHSDASVSAAGSISDVQGLRKSQIERMIGGQLARQDVPNEMVAPAEKPQGNAESTLVIAVGQTRARQPISLQTLTLFSSTGKALRIASSRGRRITHCPHSSRSSPLSPLEMVWPGLAKAKRGYV